MRYRSPRRFRATAPKPFQDCRRWAELLAGGELWSAAAKLPPSPPCVQRCSRFSPVSRFVEWATSVVRLLQGALWRQVVSLEALPSKGQLFGRPPTCWQATLGTRLPSMSLVLRYVQSRLCAAAEATTEAGLGMPFVLPKHRCWMLKITVVDGESPMLPSVTMSPVTPPAPMVKTNLVSYVVGFTYIGPS